MTGIHVLLRDTAIGGGIVVFLIIYLFYRFLHSSIGKFGLETLLWRFFTGHHHHGQRKTDAGWFSWGTRVYDKSGHATRWEHMPRAYRAAYRTGVFAAVVMILMGLAVDTEITIHALLALGVFALTAVVFVIYNRFAARSHNRQVVSPLAAALALTLRVSKSTARRLINIRPEDLLLQSGIVGFIELPLNFEGNEAQRHAVEQIVDSHLPVDAEVDWQMQGTPKRAVISIAGQPPRVFPWNQAAPLMEKCTNGQILLGLDRLKKPYYASFAVGEDPHWGFYCAPGRGKSTQLAIIAAQILHQDPESTVTFIDPKGVSVQWMDGVPNFRYIHDPNHVESMWGAIAAFRKEMERRRDLLRDNPELDFPRTVLMIDELNRFTDITKTIYAQIRERGEAPQAPVFSDLAAILWQGRQFKCNVVLVGQRLDDRSVGMSGLRDALGFRGLSGFKPNAWKMFIGTAPVPRSQAGAGRWIYVKDDEETWVQNVIGSNSQIREYASNGRSKEPAGQSDAIANENDLPAKKQSSTPPERSRIVGLRDASEYLGFKGVGGFTSARYRKPIPGEVRMLTGQPAWWPEQLDDWQNSRPRRNKREGVDVPFADEVDSTVESTEEDNNPEPEG